MTPFRGAITFGIVMTCAASLARPGRSCVGTQLDLSLYKSSVSQSVDMPKAIIPNLVVFEFEEWQTWGTQEKHESGQRMPN